MALATSTILGLAAAAGSAGLSMYNTSRTASQQDAEAAKGIRTQAGIQQRADQRVNQEVSNLEASTNADEKAAREADFMQQLRLAASKTNAGLDGSIGGEAFQASAAGARGDLQRQGAETAGLLAGIDAPALQRQGEGFGFGRLGTDISLIGRESSGQDWLTQLRTAAIKRNPWMDVGAALLGGAANGMAGKGLGPGDSFFKTGLPTKDMSKGFMPGAWPQGIPMPSNDQIIQAMRHGLGGT